MAVLNHNKRQLPVNFPQLLENHQYFHQSPGSMIIEKKATLGIRNMTQSCWSKNLNTTLVSKSLVAVTFVKE